MGRQRQQQRRGGVSSRGVRFAGRHDRVVHTKSSFNNTIVASGQEGTS